MVFPIAPADLTMLAGDAATLLAAVGPAAEGVFVEEGVRLSGSASGGPFALATSARSEVLQEFEGGPGQIAVLPGADLRLPPDASDADRRRKLAEWIASKQNPLFARTIVNRAAYTELMKDWGR